MQAATPKKRVTPGEIVILACGALALLFSFFPWFRSSFGDQTVNAWDSGLFPLATLIALAGTTMAAQVLVDRVLGASLPRALGEFTWEQIHVFLAILALLIAFCYLLVDKGNAGFDFGFYVDLFAAIGLVVGAFMLRQERRSMPVAAGGGAPYTAPETFQPPAPPAPSAPPPPPPPENPPTWTTPPPPSP